MPPLKLDIIFDITLLSLFGFSFFFIFISLIMVYFIVLNLNSIYLINRLQKQTILVALFKN
jgi:hypothetical protein